MPSTFSPNLRIELIATGEQSNTWGITTNTNLGTLLEQSISGLVEIDVTAADVTLTALNGEADQARNMILKFTGTPDAARTVTAPEVPKIYTFVNDSSKPVTLVTSASGSTGVTLSPSNSTMVFSDGTNVYKVIASGANAPISEAFLSVGTISVTNLAARTAVGNSFSFTPVSSDSSLKIDLAFGTTLRVDPPVTLGSAYTGYIEIFETTSGSTFLANMAGLGMQIWTTTYSTYSYNPYMSSVVIPNTDTVERTFQLYINPTGSLGKLNVVGTAPLVTITEVPN